MAIHIRTSWLRPTEDEGGERRKGRPRGPGEGEGLFFVFWDEDEYKYFFFTPRAAGTYGYCSYDFLQTKYSYDSWASLHYTSYPGILDFKTFGCGHRQANKSIKKYPYHKAEKKKSFTGII